jgi:2'-5' RNA ligase
VIRAFVAIELPDSLIQVVLDLIETLQDLPGSRQLRWVKPQALHLTLVFLGDVDFEIVPDISVALRTCALNQASFEIALAQPGAFPSWERARILHLGVADPSHQVSELQRSISKALEPLGFKPEKRRFTPHITLARVRNKADRDELATFAERAQQGRLTGDFSWEVVDFHLVRSELLPEGPKYSLLQSFKFGASQ